MVGGGEQVNLLSIMIHWSGSGSWLINFQFRFRGKHIFVVFSHLTASPESSQQSTGPETMLLCHCK